MASPAPAENVIVPVLEANPLAETAFSPLTETVIEPAAVAVCKLMFAPAANAKERADPAMEVPDAEMVFVPGVPEAPMMVTEFTLVPVVWLRVIFDPAQRISDPEVIAAEAPAVVPPPEAEISAAD